MSDDVVAAGCAMHRFLKFGDFGFCTCAWRMLAPLCPVGCEERGERVQENFNICVIWLAIGSPTCKS
jgi:hypothetical protein